MTQIEIAKKGIKSFEIRKVSKDESIKPGILIEKISKGYIVIPKNKNKKIDSNFRTVGIGEGLRTKVNANIGTSPDSTDISNELEKLKVAIKAGADTVMDLSTGGDINKVRREIIAHSTVPVGTVPIYQAACECFRKTGIIKKMSVEQIFEIIHQQCEEGVDFITVHCGVTRKTVSKLKKIKRLCGIVSRGGAFLAEWIIENNRENPLYQYFDKLLDIAYKYDVTLSLGDGMRPGAIADALDMAQLSELELLGELVLEARKHNVQVMVEGPGHMRLDKIQEHIIYAKKRIHHAPYYVLGPLVTDISAGFDHITSAIGGAVASLSGADFLCYVTPSEHIGLPDVNSVYEGVIASRIAAHAGDIAKNISGAEKWDREFSIARKELNWKKQEELSLDPQKFKNRRAGQRSLKKKVCSMCGDYCAMKISSKFF